MKINDLLNKIANGEEVPKKIQHQQQEIERLNKNLGDMTKLFAKEKEKNRQAIEFIEKYQIERKVKIGNVKLDKSFVNSQGLLEILKGDDINE